MFTKCNIGARSGKSTTPTKDVIFALMTCDVVTAFGIMLLWSGWDSHIHQLDFHDKVWSTNKLNLF
jgi:hypothetical protein